MARAQDLGEDEVHVFRARIDEAGEALESARAVLSAEERERADRFVFPRHRDAFIRSRAFLRRLLGSLTGEDPGALHFRLGSHGKPSLEDGGLEFNLSHSGALALCAVARGRAVGVDVERHRAGVETLEIAERFFTRRELETLRGLGEAERVAGFFLCWTRKEAYVKARGEGLSVPLDCFDVTCAPGELARLTGVGAAASEVGRWSLASLAVGDGYSAAVAALGHGWRAALFDWTPVSASSDPASR
jgi:4'-phosphopantetheinyl transferase